MTKVVALMSMSLDGFVADANDGVAEVFDWYFSGDVDVPMPIPRPDFSFRMSPPSAEHVRNVISETGAFLTGRRTFEVADGWDGRHAWDVPAFVVTHEVPEGGRELARRCSSSPTASRAPLRERKKRQPRGPWRCTAPKRSSSC